MAVFIHWGEFNNMNFNDKLAYSDSLPLDTPILGPGGQEILIATSSRSPQLENVDIVNPVTAQLHGYSARFNADRTGCELQSMPSYQINMFIRDEALNRNVLNLNHNQLGRLYLWWLYNAQGTLRPGQSETYKPSKIMLF